MDHDINLLRALFALLFVLGLIWLLGVGVRRYGWKFGLPTPKQSATKRLSLVEVMPLDTKNKLVIVRRDNTEHVLLIGAEQSLVIETDIPTHTD